MEEFWDGASKNYDKTEERFEYIHSKSRENTKKFLKGSDTVLDYGCGTGTATCQFSCQVKEVHAIDISSKMIEIAREKAAVAKVENVIFEQTDIFDSEFAKESYDVILAFNMLHTVASPQDVVLRINVMQILQKQNGTDRVQKKVVVRFTEMRVILAQGPC